MSDSVAGIKSIFGHAMELHSPEEREAYLAEACGDNQRLRAEVESLIQAAQDAGGFLDGPGPSLAETVDESPMAERPGTVIGQYKVLEQIGEGAFGVVFRAEQERPICRKVALKVLKPGMDTKQVVARFEAERQALALMDHPHIARIHDGGTTATGRPYFVMELVRGVPITDYCDQAQLDIRFRLDLFVRVCQAVQHAHQKGIIHRDLKPSNVMVTLHDGPPVPKVIDFGVAKALGQRLTDKTLFTGLAQMVGTPLYMSPEQAQLSGLDVDTRADAYSLGVLLYELLTGTTPFDGDRLKRAGYDEMRRIIREEEPPRPSARLSTRRQQASTVSEKRRSDPRRLSRLLRGELDWVVMKCLEKDRTRRYETVDALAKDVERYLADEPVQACPPSAAYRLRKFVRRNKGPVIAASAVLLSLFAGVIGTGIGLVRANRSAEYERLANIDAQEKREQAEIAEQRSENAYARTADVLDTMVSAVTGKSLATQKAITAEQKKFLTEVLTYYQEFAREKADDEKTRLRTARAAFRVGLIEYRLGRKHESAAAFRRAHDGYAALAAEFPAVPAYRQELALSQDNLGNLLADLGKRPEAEEQYRKALAIQEKLAAESPAVPAYRLDLALSHNNLGVLLRDLGKRPEAEEQNRKALALLEKLSAEFPDVPRYRQDLALSHNSLGILLAGLGKGPEVEEQYRKALAIQEKLAGESPAVPEYRRHLAKSHHNLGNLLDDLGNRPAAEAQYRKALALLEKLAAEFPAVPEYRQGLALSHNSLGLLLADLGKRPEAEEQYRKALAIQEKLAVEFSDVPAYRQELAGSHNNLGVLLGDLGKRPEAEEQNRKALALLEKLSAEFPDVPAYRHNLATSHNILGLLLARLGKRPEAEEQFRKTLALLEKLAAEFPAVPEYRRELANSHNNLGVLLAGLAKGPEAEEQYRKALANREKLAVEFLAVPAYRVELGGSYCNFGNLVLDGGKPADSLEWFAKAIGALAPIHEREPRDVTAKRYLRNSHWSRAIAQDRLQQHAEAIKDWDKAVELSPKEAQAGLRWSRAISQLRAGQAAEAVTEIAELTKSSNWNAGQWYDFACVYAVASTRIVDKKQGYADRAMELLRQAVKDGFKDVARMKKDTDLDPLRGREDFTNLLAELEVRAKQPVNKKQ